MPPSSERRGPAPRKREGLLHPTFKPNFLDLLVGLGERGFYKGLDPAEIVRLRIEAWLTRASESGEYARLRGFDRNEPGDRGGRQGGRHDAEGAGATSGDRA